MCAGRTDHDITVQTAPSSDGSSQCRLAHSPGGSFAAQLSSQYTSQFICESLAAQWSKDVPQTEIEGVFNGLGTLHATRRLLERAVRA